MKTTKLKTIFLTALCAGGCSEPGGPRRQNATYA